MIQNSKRFLFLSTLNLATNPRLYKEIRLAVDCGYKVTVICFEFDNWSTSFNQELKSSLSNISIITIPGGRSRLLPWLKSVLLERFFRGAGRFISLPDSALSQAISRRSMLLIKELKTLKESFDLVIGHNPGALYPSIWAAKKYNSAVGFDIEDYHPGQGDDKNEQWLTKLLVQRMLPKMNYVSFASAFIMGRTCEDLKIRNKSWFVVLNYFMSTDFEIPEQINTGPLQLVWFSQNIDYGRGLEQIVPALSGFKNQIELTLIGNKKQKFFDEHLSDKNSIKVMHPVDQKSLHKMIGYFDVGLAIEPGKDINNIMALSNKLFAYFQSGLYILASDTPAQNEFFKEHPGHGFATSLSKDNLYNNLQVLLSKLDLIRNEKRQRCNEAKQNSWETESQKLRGAWQQILN